MRKWLITIALVYVAAFAAADTFVFGKATTLNRFSFETQSEVIESSCLLWLTFEVDDGTNYYDYSTSANDGIAPAVANQPAYTNAAGGAIDLDGINDQVRLGTGASLGNFTQSDPFTISAWFRLSDDASGYIIRMQGPSGGYPTISLKHTSTNGNMQGELYDGSTWNGVNLSPAAGVFPPSEWRHVVYVRDRVSDKIIGYINGGAVSNSASDTTSGNFNNAGSIWRLGIGDAGLDPFKGQIGDVHLFDTALTPAQVTNLWAGTVNTYWPFWDTTDPNYANSVLQYPFTVEPSTTNFWVRDESHANPDATLTGGNVGSQIVAANQPAYSNAGGTTWLQFDGINDRVVGVAPSTTPIGAKTIMFWMRCPTGTTERFIYDDYNQASAKRGTSIYLTTDGKLGWSGGKAASGDQNWLFDSVVRVDTNQWLHMACAWDGTADAGAMHIYRNGVILQNGTADTTEAAASTNRVSWSGLTTVDLSFYPGALDDCRVYDVELSSNAIYTIWSKTPH